MKKLFLTTLILYFSSISIVVGAEKVKVEFIVDKDGTVKNPVVVIRNNFTTYCKKLNIF